MDEESQIESLEARIRVVEWVLLGIVGVVLAFFSIACLTSTLCIGSFEVMFTAVLEGRPLPTLTQLIIDIGRSGLLSALSVFVPFGAFVLIIIKPKRRWSWVCVITVLVFLAFLTSCIIVGLFLPWLSIIGY